MKSICDHCRWKDEIVGPVATGDDEEPRCREENREDCIDYEPETCPSLWLETDVNQF